MEEHTKECIRCGVSKPISAYYRHKEMVGGHLKECKECKKQDSQIRERKLRKNPEWCEKERIRSRERYHRLGYRDRQYAQNKQKKYKNSKYKNLHKKLKLPKDYEVHHWNYSYIDDYIILHKDLHRFIHRYIYFDDKTWCFKTEDGTLLDTRKAHEDFIELIKLIYNQEKNPESANV